jgi:UDP-3-O-[3-hydroxymyristoyl] glucosamine N-acyltransferase
MSPENHANGHGPQPRVLRADQIALRLGGHLEGRSDGEIRGARPIEQAGPGEITILTQPNPTLLQQSRAACVLVPRTLTSAEGRTVIRVDNPRLALARVIGWLGLRPGPAPGVHPTAVVHPTARLGADVSVGPYCVIGAGAEIGADTVLYAHVTVYDGVKIGRRCLLHAGVVVGADGFGFTPDGDHYQKIPQIGGVEIGDDVEIGANSTIDRGTLAATRIGAGTKIDNLVQVGHNCVIGAHCTISAQTGLAGSTQVGDWVVIGGQVGIGDHVRIDSQAVVGSAAAIPTGKHIHAGEPVWGVPARPLKQHLRALASLARVEQLRRDVHELLQRHREPAAN